MWRRWRGQLPRLSPCLLPSLLPGSCWSAPPLQVFDEHEDEVQDAEKAETAANLFVTCVVTCFVCVPLPCRCLMSTMRRYRM